MVKTKIEWADAVWNPITGCTPISVGCEHCYAKRMANRLKGRYGYPEDDPFRVTYHPDRIDEPFYWKKPRRVFVGSMTDIFHEDSKFKWLESIFSVMHQCREQTFMVLTKRPRAAKMFLDSNLRSDIFKRWPLPNVMIGVTAENQARADERIPILLQIPAAVRFVSIEPMLTSVDLTRIPIPYGLVEINGGRLEPIDWVICGGESGPGARPAKAEWFNSTIDQCKSAGVPVFVKKAPAGVPIIREFPGGVK